MASDSRRPPDSEGAVGEEKTICPYRSAGYAGDFCCLYKGHIGDHIATGTHRRFGHEDAVRLPEQPPEAVNHPDHYGGDTLHEVIKCLIAWDRQMAYGFCVGNAIKYLARAGKKSDDVLTDLRKARWYTSKAAEIMEGQW